jgi:tetratricopeptide (TPR) repeat protein
MIAAVDGGQGAVVMTNSSNSGALYWELLRSIAFEYQWKDYTRPVYESVDDALDAFRKMNRDSPNDPDISEERLNTIGYEMLGAHEYATAIAVLELNAEFYPTSANVYDSLAEAYLTSGNEEKAIEFYKKALAILDEYPKENERFQRFRVSIPERLKELEQ